jgi:CheY-like chemotaxis protein
MDDGWHVDAAHASEAWIQTEINRTFDGASILIVEDDPDIRDLLSTLLEMAGYSATAYGTAEQGLNALREETFDFVLTDYALPNRTGGWLLQQAQREGLLDATPALVVTAHPSPPDVAGFDVFQKPFDLDHLITHVRQRLDDGGPVRARRQTTARPAGSRSGGGSGDGNGNGNGNGDGNTQDDGCPEPIELILYVSADSPRSAHAIADIKRVLSRYRSDKVTLTICDLAANPAMGEGDSIAFTPSLVRRSSGPRTYILGHITNPKVLIELLEGCDLDS